MPIPITRTKFVSYRATAAEHRSIKASAAQMGISIGDYVAKAVATFRKAERAAKRGQPLAKTQLTHGS